MKDSVRQEIPETGPIACLFAVFVLLSAAFYGGMCFSNREPAPNAPPLPSVGVARGADAPWSWTRGDLMPYDIGSTNILTMSAPVGVTTFATLSADELGRPSLDFDPNFPESIDWHVVVERAGDYTLTIALRMLSQGSSVVGVRAGTADRWGALQGAGPECWAVVTKCNEVDLVPLGIRLRAGSNLIRIRRLAESEADDLREDMKLIGCTLEPEPGPGRN